jgi:hypothetical protein
VVDVAGVASTTTEASQRPTGRPTATGTWLTALVIDAAATRVTPLLHDGLQERAMVSRVSHTTIDCVDAFEASEWWKQVLGYVDVPGDPNEPGDEECMILDAATGHALLFVEVGELSPQDGRIHLDLVPTDRRRDDEVERVQGLGATVQADRRRADGCGWVVAADPWGNRFCITRSDTERAETGEPPMGSPVHLSLHGVTRSANE